MKKLFSKLVLAALLAGCAEDTVKELSIPYPITNTPIELSGLGVTLSGSVKSNDKNLKTGFLISESDLNPDRGFSAYIISSDSTSNNEFFSTIRDGLIKDRIYYVRSYIEVDQRKIFGNAVPFRSLGSEGHLLYSFEPQSASFEDTVTLSGIRFVPGETFIKFGNLDATYRLLSINDSIIKIKVPWLNERNVKISVVINNISKQFEETFEFTEPVILGITPAQAALCDTIQINGKYFKEPFWENSVVINNLQATKLDGSKSYLEVIVPPLTDGSILSDEIIFASWPFEYKYEGFISLLPELSNFSLLEGVEGDTILLNGSNLSKCYAYIEFQDETGVKYETDYFLHLSNSQIKAVVPTCSDNVSIIVHAGGVTRTYDDKFKAIGPVITSVEPNHGKPGDIITIRGENFSYPFPIVKLLRPGNSIELGFISANKNEIKAQIFPSDIRNEFFDLYVGGRNGSNCKSFTLPNAFVIDPD